MVLHSTGEPGTLQVLVDAVSVRAAAAAEASVSSPMDIGEIPSRCFEPVDIGEMHKCGVELCALIGPEKVAARLVGLVHYMKVL